MTEIRIFPSDLISFLNILQLNILIVSAGISSLSTATILMR